MTKENPNPFSLTSSSPGNLGTWKSWGQWLKHTPRGIWNLIRDCYKNLDLKEWSHDGKMPGVSMVILKQGSLSSDSSTCHLALSTALREGTQNHHFHSSILSWGSVPKVRRVPPNHRTQSLVLLSGISVQVSVELKTSHSLKSPWNISEPDSALGATLEVWVHEIRC